MDSQGKLNSPLLLSPVPRNSMWCILTNLAGQMWENSLKWAFWVFMERIHQKNTRWITCPITGDELYPLVQEVMLAEGRDRQRRPGDSREVSMRGDSKSWSSSSGKQRCQGQTSQNPPRSVKDLLWYLQGSPGLLCSCSVFNLILFSAFSLPAGTVLCSAIALFLKGNTGWGKFLMYTSICAPLLLYIYYFKTIASGSNLFV